MEATKLLTELVGIKSYSGDEKKLHDYISKWFKARNIATTSQEGNLIVHLKAKGSKKAFIFNSHMDTVAAGDEGKWKYGPFKPTKVDNKLFGLGTSDMKAGLASSMLLAEKLASQKDLPTDVWFVFVTKEEIDGSGTKSFVEWFEKNKYLGKYSEIAAIFTEPTGLEEIENGHRGNIFLEVETTGDSGHASRPLLLKEHAVRNMLKFADLLQDSMIKWKKEFSSDIFEPPTAGEMTSIYAGVEIQNDKIVGASPNKFPASCIATFDIRTTPDFHKVAFARIKRLGDEVGVKMKLAFPDAPAGYTSPDEKIVKIAQSILPESKLVVSQGSADLGFFVEKGIKSIVLGPGEKEMAHRVDEYCLLPQIPQAVEAYEKIIRKWSKVNK